jgi:hypothetical protein
MASKDDTPSFDFDADPLLGLERSFAGGLMPVARVSVAVEWREVPAARFLSWPLAMQMAYCRDRDLDSAEHAESEEWQQFYLRRANGYDEASKNGI